MNRIIALLEEKNHYLEKFYALNEKELIPFLQGNFDAIESFYETRERILEVLNYIDARIEADQRTEAANPTAEERRQIRTSLTIKDEYVARIVEQDLQVLSCIEAAKNNIIRELQDLKKGKKAVSGYKAPTFTNRLDEEA